MRDRDRAEKVSGSVSWKTCKILLAPPQESIEKDAKEKFGADFRKKSMPLCCAFDVECHERCKCHMNLPILTKAELTLQIDPNSRWHVVQDIVKPSCAKHGAPIALVRNGFLVRRFARSNVT